MPDVIVTLAISRDNLMTSNHRTHWADKARRTKAIRDMAWIWCKHEHRHARLEAADLTVTATWPDHRVRDASAIAPMVKAAVDGCVDAGLLADDNHKILRSETYRIADETKQTPGVACYLQLVFTPVEPAYIEGGV